MTYQAIKEMTSVNQRPTTARRRKAGRFVSGKLADVCRNLKPFQSLEFDPERGLVEIVTELIVPVSDEAQIAEILLRHCGTAKILIQRFADSYKIALTRQIRL